LGRFPDISSVERHSSRSDRVHDERRTRFEGLFRSHADAVRGYALRRSDPHEADDVVAETFLIAWRRFDDVPANAGPWLLGVARRVLSNRRRSDHRVVSLSDRLAERERRKPSTATDEVDLRLTIEAALERLPEKEREAFSSSPGKGSRPPKRRSCSGARERRSPCGCTALGVASRTSSMDTLPG
jgi:RNA polymerase sigma factor (sigma-70 family)